MEKFFKNSIHKDNLLKLLILLFSCKKSDLSIKTFCLVHTVTQQSHKKEFCLLRQLRQPLWSLFDLFIPIFGQFWYQHWGQVFLSSIDLCNNDQLIAQSHELVEICLSQCKNVYQSELFVVTFFWKL